MNSFPPLDLRDNNGIVFIRLKHGPPYFPFVKANMFGGAISTVSLARVPSVHTILLQMICWVYFITWATRTCNILSVSHGSCRILSPLKPIAQRIYCLAKMGCGLVRCFRASSCPRALNCCDCKHQSSIVVWSHNICGTVSLICVALDICECFLQTEIGSDGNWSIKWFCFIRGVKFLWIIDASHSMLQIVIYLANSCVLLR